MFRILFLILGAILLISVIRSVAGVLMKGLGALMNPDSPPPSSASASRPDVPLAGELRKDPVCGTYVSTSTKLTKVSAGQTYYFCSPECRDKFA